MAIPEPFYAYKETRLNLDSAFQGSTVSINLPSLSGATPILRSTNKRSRAAPTPFAEDDTAFRHRYLATAASIYHRTQDNFPASYLWRVLEDGNVFSIRAIDVSRPVTADDANLTLRLTLPCAIRPGCIALSDCQEHDVLSVFIYTESAHLYTLSLRPDFFRKPASTKDNVGDWCKVYPVRLSFKQAHRMVALSASELFFSWYDGSHIKLTRTPGGDGSVWVENGFNEGGALGAVVGLVRWGVSKSFVGADDGKSMQPTTATAISSPKTVLGETSYAFTVCLDHKLRIWNLTSGHVEYNADITNPTKDQYSDSDSVIDSSFSQLVRVFKTSLQGISAICVTYSPIGLGEFKFWAIDVAGGKLRVEDLFPGNKLVPRAPSSEPWTLADFSVHVKEWNSDSFVIWTLWKNNTTYRVQKLAFNHGANVTNDATEHAWKNDWLAMANEMQVPLPTVFSGDPSDSTDKWLDHIMFPGRFTRATIETGLAIYDQKTRSSSRSSPRVAGHLADRMCTTIASVVSLGRSASGGMDYEQFRIATDTQWRRFHRLLVELDKQRGEALSLVYNPRGDMPFVVSADGVSAIRDCSQVEKLWHNADSPLEGSEDVSALISAAAEFRSILPAQVLYSCESMLRAELFEEPSQVPSVRMRAIYDQADFANQVTDEDYAQLVASLGGGFKNITYSLYTELLQGMTESTSDNDPEIPLAELGNKLIVKGIQETVELHRSICLDQLYLLILIECEINHSEEGTEFETSQVFHELLMMLKKLELCGWLAKTQLDVPVSRVERARSNSHADRSSPSKKPTETVTVLEGVLRHLFGLDSKSDVSMSTTLTNYLIETCSPASKCEAPPANIQGFLLKHDRADLAMQFTRFTEHDAFSTYIQGRVSLASNDPLGAARLFKKSAFGMANVGTSHHSAGFLNETEKRMLNAGLPEYYAHIVSLYDKEKMPSFVIDFARLALQFVKGDDAIRTEMHSRLFTAALQTSRWDAAHTAIASFTDTALQTSSLRTLITRMCEGKDSQQQLIDLPFVGLQDQVDEILAQKCQSIESVAVGIPYHNYLYAWRIKHSDFRGAAAISLERLHRLQQAHEGARLSAPGGGDDELDTPVTRQYIATINALCCVDAKQAWILCEPPLPGKRGGEKSKRGKRQVVTLVDLRRDYQEELDRLAAIENNQFAFGAGDADADGDGDADADGGDWDAMDVL